MRRAGSAHAYRGPPAGPTGVRAGLAGPLRGARRGRAIRALRAFYAAGAVAGDTPLAEVPMVAIDVETTGLIPPATRSSASACCR